jgi:hypothetical protein
MKKTSENTEGAIKNGQSRETGKIGYTQRRKMKQKHNNYKSWTPLYTNNTIHKNKLLKKTITIKRVPF